MHFFRSDAERAMKYMLGENVDGFEMKMGWGKGVPIPLHPIYVPPALLKVTRPPEPNGLPFTCQATDANQEGKQKKWSFQLISYVSIALISRWKIIFLSSTIFICVVGTYACN